MSLDRVDRLAAVDSTNAEAMRRAQKGERGPLWIVADSQTMGRGRSGRSWASEPGNFHASLLLTLSRPAPRAYQLALVAGVAVHDALVGVARPDPIGLGLKWPNDILIDAVKAGGILIESSASTHGLAAVIGIGINLATAPQGLDRPATCLAAHGVNTTPDALLAEIASATEVWLAIWAEGAGFETVREAWLKRAHPIGERLSIDTGAERVGGAFMGLDGEGALVLETQDGTRRFTFGDVSLAPE
jgi:BirA family biotin operon repressor/biotin-[acetyl-CoA-carboxylase] ligase